MTGQLTIDLKAVAENYRVCRDRAGQACEAAAVVKADCYGLGMGRLAPALWAAGARTFFVALFEEAMALRALLPEARIAVLHGLEPGAEKDYVENHFIPVLGSLADVERAAKLAHRAAVRLPAILHLDTGMNRLGVEPHRAAALAQDKDRLEALDILYVMSHFACADEDHEMNGRQYELFGKLAALFPGVKRSLANSPGLFRDSAYALDLARPGMALYGLNPAPETPNPMRPVVTLEVPVLQVREGKKGETVGYGATHTLERDMRLAAVALGYADGFLRSLGRRGTLYWKGRPLPVLGRVSMDLAVVSLDGLGETQQPRPGDMLEVIGPHQSADALAEAAGTIGYEIMTALGARYRRIYL